MVTPGAFDIAAIQKMYGAVAHNEGPTLYILKGNFDNAPNASFSTIWDTGGIDTIQYDGSGDPIIDNDAASGVTIDLRYATLKDEPGGGGFISQFRGNTSHNAASPSPPTSLTSTRTAFSVSSLKTRSAAPAAMRLPATSLSRANRSRRHGYFERRRYVFRRDGFRRCGWRWRTR
jgi:hypothetical protein